MKKMLPCLAVLLFVSCMTGRMHDAFYSADGLGLPVFFQIANVSVQLDHLEEASLAGQVRTMGDTFLLARQNACHESAVKFYIDLSISQRSFTQGSNFYNSIFIACTVRNSAGKVLALENECISGYRSIENSSCLGKILNRILKRVISAFGNAKNAIAWMGAQKGKRKSCLRAAGKNRVCRMHRKRLQAFVAAAILFLALPETALGESSLIIFNTADAAVEFGVKRSQLYKLQRQSMLETMAAAKKACHNFLPVLGISFSESDTVNMLSADSRTKMVQFSVTHSLYDGGRRKQAYEAGKIYALYAYQEYENQLCSYKSEIAKLYSAIVMQQEMLLIKNKLFSIAAAQLAIMEKEVELGFALETDYLEYKISFIQIEEEKEQLERDTKNLKLKLAYMLELPESQELLVSGQSGLEKARLIYEPKLEQIWKLAKTSSTELKKREYDFVCMQKSAELDRRWYLPNISLVGTLAFSGNAYPLTEPKYSLKLTFDFNKPAGFPFSLESSSSFDGKRINSISNSMNASIKPPLGIASQKRQASLQAMQGQMQISAYERELKSKVRDLVIAHDNAVRMIESSCKTIELMEKRLEFIELQLAAGEIKQIDYLKNLEELARMKVSLFELEARENNLEQSLEILAFLPFGELKNACSM